MKITRLFCLFLVSMLPYAHGAVTYHDFEDVTFQNIFNTKVFFDMDATDAGQVISDTRVMEASDFIFFNLGNPNYFALNYDAANWGALASNASGSTYSTRLSAGDVIADQVNAGSFFIHTSNTRANFKVGTVASPWDGDDGTTKRYMGFGTADGNQMAWLGLYYNSTTQEITFTDMARADGLADLSTFAAGNTVSAVPEPAETAFITALFLMGAVYIHRRMPRKDMHTT